MLSFGCLFQQKYIFYKKDCIHCIFAVCCMGNKRLQAHHAWFAQLRYRSKQHCYCQQPAQTICRQQLKALPPGACAALGSWLAYLCGLVAAGRRTGGRWWLLCMGAMPSQWQSPKTSHRKLTIPIVLTKVPEARLAGLEQSENDFNCSSSATSALLIPETNKNSNFSVPLIAK